MNRFTGNTVILTATSILTGLMLVLAEYLISPCFTDYSSAWLIPLFLAASLITLLIFHLIRGSAESQEMNHTLGALGALGVKLLLTGIIALIWFGGMKKEEVTDILLFFIVYLAFAIVTLYLIVRRLTPGD